MDAVVHGALEEICSQGPNGLPLANLWPKLHSHLSSNGLHLCNSVKKAIWTNLLNIPSLRFESLGGVSYNAQEPNIQSFEDSEAMGLKIVAMEHLLNSFVGVYDIKASDAAISQQQRRVLERLAIARTNGITQSELAKEFGIKGNNIYYILKNLETRGLIVRQSTIIRKKEAGSEGEQKSSSVVNTNMLHLYRYAKHLGHLQRLEITKEDKAFTDTENVGRDVATVDGVPECVKEDVHIQDYVPALREICDRLEKADGKVLVVSDIKRELNYRNTSGHRAWRNILHRLKDARIVEEFCAKVNNKKVSCLRLLKKFSPKTFDLKTHGGGDDDLAREHVKLGKRGQITDQLLELPIEQQIYDMIAAEGSKGLIINEVYKRLGISNKRYYPRILDMVSRFGMRLDSEGLNRGVVYRVWTSHNLNPEVLDTLPGNLENMVDENHLAHAHAAQTFQEAVDITFKEDAEASGEKSTPIESRIPNSSPAVNCDEQNMASDASGIVPNEELQIVSVKPVSNVVSLQMSPSASPPPRTRKSSVTYPCLSLNSASLQREQRILEKLQEEKILIKPELHRLLESLENLEKEKYTTMDRKTLVRSVNKLQEEGYCKCVSFTFPVITNCGRNRTIDVILHPSVYNAEDLSDRIHERLRSFEKQIRAQGFPRQNQGKSIPVLNDVERIQTSTRKDYQAETREAMRDNGFILAKMIRAKFLHIFLWGYITTSPGWDDAISSGKHEHEQMNPHSTCKLFELDAAIKAMPLELFLQVAGSTVRIDNMIEKCRNGVRLSDLPVQEYRCLMETRATARLSYLIDILRRLRLIRLIGGELLNSADGQHATLRHSLELKPYIEEPVAMVLPSKDVDSGDLRPHVRHDFVLASRRVVDKYWNTLEYCYAACDPKAALHSFPGSAVPEVFLSRSWASVRVMTADQRSELFKRVANDNSNKMLSYRQCEQIAEDLNLTLEQVLRVFHGKLRKRLQAASAKGEELRPRRRASLSRKRKRSSKGKTVNMTFMGYPPEEESGKQKHTKISDAEDATEEQYSFIRSLKDHETHMLISETGEHNAASDDQDLNVAGKDHASIDECVLSKLNSACRKRFLWTESADRQLVIEYVRHRAAIGAKFHRTDWHSIQELPAPPGTCRRRMAALNCNNQFRKAVMRLCNMLSARYVKHLENSSNNLLGDKCKKVIRDQSCNKDIAGNVSASIDCSKDLEFEERWDDFDNENMKASLDEVLRYKQTTKLEATKSAGYISKYARSDVSAEGQELHGTRLASSATPSKELKQGSRWRQVSVRRSRCHLPKDYVRLMNGGKGFGTQAYKSLAVSNAVELFKLVFLSTAKGPEVPNLLAETLRRYSEHDLFAAFDYLRHRNFMVGSHGVSQFALSQQFLHNISSSPFPVNTGKRAVKIARWLQERENDLLDEGIDLSPDLQCGDVFLLCALVSSGEVSISPCLPDEGVGEIEEMKKRKCKDNEICSADKAKKPKIMDSEIFSRKGKGFPGLRLSLGRNMISRVDAVTFFRDENANSALLSWSERGPSSCLNLAQHLSAPEHREETFDSGDASSKPVTSESAWEAMTSYAAYLASCMQRESPFFPHTFRTVYSAIQRAGDQGLSMEGISQIMDVQGEEMLELIVEVLETFGQVLKVNAYDRVHVVDSLYRSKYFLSSMVSHNQDLGVPKSCTSDGEPLIFQPEILEGEDTNLPKETCMNFEAGTNSDEMHRVTILNHPKEVSQPLSETRGDNENETCHNTKIMYPRKDPENRNKFYIRDSPSCKPILPWVNGDGTINEIVFKGLVRRVLGIVMQNPGILEHDVLSQMNVLNPQSCRKLLELMILDNHIKVRKMYQSASDDPPAILGGLLSSSSKKPKLVCREHFFANPMSISCL